ncbi:hypothetical protein HSB1_21930 [Halogranum salarium B-1]|uniref:Uncharacterized protein n=1 Tax=Halogranum salarium B-1 TaxID=1210908 RepID=J2ZH58_9EURY|nr:hypothetical protein HSB1_21930 [Halogranum salarium B-1]
MDMTSGYTYFALSYTRRSLFFLGKPRRFSTLYTIYNYL